MKSVLDIINKLNDGIQDNLIIDNNYLRQLEFLLNDLYKSNNIDKERLISKFIQINGETAFKFLQVESVDQFIKKLPTIIRAASAYIMKTNDSLYFFAELSVAIDWVLYKSINLGTD